MARFKRGANTYSKFEFPKPGVAPDDVPSITLCTLGEICQRLGMSRQGADNKLNRLCEAGTLSPVAVERGFPGDARHPKGIVLQRWFDVKDIDAISHNRSS